MKENRFFAHIILLAAGLVLLSSGCDNSAEEFEKKGPKKRETRRVIVDVHIVSDEDKTNFEAVFYYDIPGMVDGKEVSGFKKEIISVKDAKLDDLELKESKDFNDRTIYTVEIPNEAKEYKLTFSPNENLSATHKIKVDPMFIKEENFKLEKSKIHELKLSRKAIPGELPAVVEIKKGDDFLPTRIEYLDQKLFFQEDALKPFPNGENVMRVRFETIPNQREENKSIRNLNYIISKTIEIVD